MGNRIPWELGSPHDEKEGKGKEIPVGRRLLFRTLPTPLGLLLSHGGFVGVKSVIHPHKLLEFGLG